MKLKLFFRMLLCSMALLSFAACSDDDDSLFIEDGIIAYVGDVVVDQNDGTTYTAKDVKIDLTFYAVANTAEMLVKQVKFAEKMPIRLDMTVKGIDFTIAGSGITIVGNNIVPEAMGGPFPAYTIINLSGKVTDSDFSFSMKCGEFPVTFTGKAVLTSAK